MCAALDCDDTDASIRESAETSCYGGPPNTAGVGVCREGHRLCAGGMWGPCVGEVTPGAEACNNLDDDCDGKTDEAMPTISCGQGACANTVSSCDGGTVHACKPKAAASATDATANGIDDDCNGIVDDGVSPCIPVAANGDDAKADGSHVKPFKTIQNAIDWAVAHPAGSQNVCVAAVDNCNAGPQVFDLADGMGLTMANGVSVIGGYEWTGWTRCANATAPIHLKSSLGVVFPKSVMKPTLLDGFSFTRFNDTTTSGITVDASVGAIIANVKITFPVSATKSYGVNVINGAYVTLTGSTTAIDGGGGTSESIGVRVVASKAIVQGVCANIDALGRCDQACTGANAFLRGRNNLGTGEAYAILLEDAADSSIEATTVCNGGGDTAAAIRVRGASDGSRVLASSVENNGGTTDSHGIWTEACGGATPWIAGNKRIVSSPGSANARSAAIRAAGDCHPIIDSNDTIGGAGSLAQAVAEGVHCTSVGGKSSGCVIVGNHLIAGGLYPAIPFKSVAVHCDDGACKRIERNVITGGHGTTAWGLSLEKAGPVVDANEIRGGCSPSPLGIRAGDSYARLQNNLVSGFSSVDCSNMEAFQVATSRAMIVYASPSVNEVDVHSNTFNASGKADQNCTSTAIAFGTEGPVGPLGIYRNNIISGGVCMGGRVGFAEASTSSDPRIFENNDLYAAAAGTTLYNDEGTTALLVASDINALKDTTVSSNLDVNPNVSTDGHLSGDSPVIDKGTKTGAPAWDRDGNFRQGTPDIGCDEF
jgi:hypothetical protein